MGKSESTLKFKAVARPKYIEEISGDEAAVHQPWEIMMMIQATELDPTTYPCFVYIRAQKPEHAAMMAHQLWAQWERNEKGHEYHKYPDVTEMGGGCGIDEQEFQEQWKEAQRYEHRYQGMKENPSAFICFKPGRGGRAYEKSKIIVPQSF